MAEPAAATVEDEGPLVTPTETNIGLPLTGQVALVTGSGRGLGHAFAERLAGLGCKIVIHGRREEGPAEYGEGTTLTAVAEAITARFGVESMKVLGDLTIAADVDNLVKEVLEKWGQIDILVHNAGGDIAAAGGKPNPNDAIHVKDEDVIAVMGKNLNSTILINQRVARGMQERRAGRIINVSSVDSILVAEGGERGIYSTAKAGVNHFTRVLAKQLQPYNVNVNAICPGATRTGRFMHNAKKGAQGDWIHKLKTGGTLDRVAMVDEVARVVDFFAGHGGSFITGQVLRVDGGASLGCCA